MDNHPLTAAFADMRENDRMFSYIAVSRLSEKNNTPEGMKFILDHFAALKTTDICEIVTMANNDVFVFYDRKNEDYIKMMAFRINYFLSGEKAVEDNTFITVYSKDNITDAEKLIADAVTDEKKMITLDSEKTFPDTAVKSVTDIPHQQPSADTGMNDKISRLISPPRPARPIVAMTPKNLNTIEKTLSRADLSSMLRRQQICSLVGNTAMPVMLFEEIYVSIEEIRNSIMPDISIDRGNWLFRHLTEILDRRMLGIISRHDDGSYFKNFSININVSSILSGEFTRFDDSISPMARGTVVLEIDAVDIFKDIDFYISARNYVKGRGYKICIDGVTDRLLPFVNREKMGADLIKIPWHDSYSSKSFDSFAIKQNNPEKVVLCHVDNENALDIGRELGIVLFQGHYIDRMKNQTGVRRPLSVPSRV